MCGGKGAGVVQLIQLMKDLRSESSCLPLSACKFPVCLIPSFYVSRKRAREGRTEETNQNKQGKRNIKTFIALTRCVLTSVSSI